MVFFIKMFLFYDDRIEFTRKNQSNFQITVVEIFGIIVLYLRAFRQF